MYGVYRSLLCTFGTTCSKATPPASTTTTTTTTAAVSTATASPTTRIVLFAVLWLGSVIHKECIEWERVGENKVSDIVAANRQGIERNGVAIPRCHLDRFQVCVHLHIDTYNVVQDRAGEWWERQRERTRSAPVIVPCTIDPFLSSIVTVSLFNFIKNLRNRRQ